MTSTSTLLKLFHFVQVISVSKSTNESLGIVVAGGTSGARGDLPVFVQDVQPSGLLGRDKRLLRGDLLVEVNGKHLTGLSHGEAIAELKIAAQHCKEVVLVGGYQQQALGQWPKKRPKNFEGVKMFDFRRITLFSLEKRLSQSTKWLRSKNFGWHGPFGSPGYAYGCGQSFFLRFRLGDRWDILSDRNYFIWTLRWS